MRAFILRELCDYPSNWRSSMTAEAFLRDVMVITGIDTRHLTQHIRDHGSLYAVLTTEDADIEALAAKAKELSQEPKHLVEEVTCSAPAHRGAGPTWRC